MVMTALVTIVAAYLLGSINFAVIFAKAFLKKDVRELGSGNAGTTNVMRNAGFLPGALTFIFDALKGFASSFMGKLIFDYISEHSDSSWAVGIYGAYACGLACVVGHVFPIFFGFKGGKGVATCVGIFAICSHWAIIMGISVFAICLFVSKYVSLSSILATVTVVAGSVIFGDESASVLPQFLMCVSMALIIILKHTSNIKRLLAGTENRIGKKGR